MKRITPLFVLLLGLVATPILSAAPPAEAPSKTTLHVDMIVPPTGDLWHEDQISEAFVNSVRHAFRRHGFEGPVEEVFLADKVPADQPLLTIRLLRWRQTRTGGVDCTFSAEVRPVNGPAKSLGVFTTTDPGIAITNRWSLIDAFVDTARRGADDLWRKLVETQAAPSITTVAKR